MNQNKMKLYSETEITDMTGSQECNNKRWIDSEEIVEGYEVVLENKLLSHHKYDTRPGTNADMCQAKWDWTYYGYEHVELRGYLPDRSYIRRVR